MELNNVNNKLYLFGGSGPHAFCFNDLYTFDPLTSSWEHCNNFKDVEENPSPKARAGHSMTLVGCKLYIIGGSYGQDYLKDVYILDTDPCPDFSISEKEQLSSKKQKENLHSGIADMLNKEEFSDVTFEVEGKLFYGHKVIISQLSQKFKAMFSTNASSGFLESKQNKIKVDNIPYSIFSQIMAYLYTGHFSLGPLIQKCIEMHEKELDKISCSESNKDSKIEVNYTYLNQAIEFLIDFLRVADELLLENVKNHCQYELIKLIDERTYHMIAEMGELYNAERIVEYCQWF